MRRIAVINQKGGSGKTTTSVSLGATLAEKGQRVLIIDLDPQYSATTWLATEPVDKGIFPLFSETETTELEDLIKPTTTPNLSLVGSSAWLVGAEKALANEPGPEFILREKLSPIEDKFDYVLIDCPPTLGILTVNALTAMHEVLIPVEAHVMGLQGLAQVLQTIEVIKRRTNPALRVTGILACRVDQRTNHGPEVVAMLRTNFSETCKTFIRENIKLAECPSMGKPITAYASTSTGCEDYRALAQEIIEKEEEYTNAKVANS